MSFTSEIKKEICKEEIDAQMMKAQLCALFQMRASLHMNWQGMYLSFQTENATIAKHVFQIMKTLYDVDPRLSVLKKMQLKKNNIYRIQVFDKAQEILEDLQILTDSGLRYTPSVKMVRSEKMARAYLQGCFLASGSINSPKSSNYHLEMSSQEKDLALSVQKLMQRFYLPAKVIERKSVYVVYIKAGDKITLSDLLYGLLLHSGNDNATAIAEYVGGSMDGFAEMMNKEAAKLMATGTHFVNSNGLHNDNHYTTAYDLYLIFNECIKHDDFVKIIMAKSHTAKVTGNDGTVRSITWEPTNFYATGDAKKPDNVTVIGGKTGTTQLAGNCLILLTKDKNNHPYISIVMKADTKPLLYKDMTAIVEAIPENN